MTELVSFAAGIVVTAGIGGIIFLLVRLRGQKVLIEDLEADNMRLLEHVERQRQLLEDESPSHGIHIGRQMNASIEPFR